LGQTSEYYTVTEVPVTSTVAGSTIEETLTSITPILTSQFTVTSVTTAIPQTYLETGETKITSYYTVTNPQRPQPPTPETIQITKVHEGTTIVEVYTPAAKTVVTDYNEVQTKVYTPEAQTIVTRIGGSETMVVVVVTPTPESTPVVVPVATTIGGSLGTFTVEQTPQTVVSTIDGTVTTIVTTPPPKVITSLVGGTPTIVTVEQQRTGAFNPITMTVVSNVGGSPATFTTTEAQTLVTSIDGKLTTIVTSIPRTFTTMTGGTLTTATIVTTPTASNAISFTVVSTIGETVSTIVSTFAPSTLVTTISGKLTTIVSTPSPSTFRSTIKPSTTTIMSITTPTPTTAGGPEVVAVVTTFSLTGADYFVGRFLPVIIAVLLAIPLRVIDLNAKLYQPFYALAREGGALGANSMTLHYNGFRGFVTPFATMFQGHPVPFITTMLVWGSALMAPLATEALGLKLHGHCHIAAIGGCAVAIGVSPAPTHALVALIALCATLLLALLFFLRNWETGLHANPWSIAGIASLAVNPDVRVHTHDEKSTKRAFAEKRFGFGFFEAQSGRDEYGIVLYDDSGRSLQSGINNLQTPDPHSDGEYDPVYDVPPGGIPTKRHVVPFIALSYTWRLLFAFFLSGLLVVILYYHITLTQRTSFKSFLDSQTFGVRFFFAALGVIVTFCWMAFFVSKSSWIQ
jgi:fluoride exporter